MKLTLVSIVFRGRTYFRFIQAKMVGGKAFVPASVISDLCNEAGAPEHSTITVG